jgi:peptide/nickel transport system substrate-binding protein
VKLRQAVNFAIDRAQIREIIYEGESVDKDYMAFPWMAGFEEPSVRYNYDPVKARALAAEAGVSRERPINVSMILTSASQKIGETIQQQLAGIGINLTLDLMEYNAWATETDVGNFQIAAGGFYMVYKDMNILSWFYASSAIDYGNTARYRNVRVDQLFALGRREVNSQKRAVYYKEALDIFQEEAPYVVYANPSTIRSYNKNLVVANSYANNIFIRDVSWK